MTDCKTQTFNSGKPVTNCDRLDPVGSTVRYEMMKLCTGSVLDTMRRWQLVIDDTGSVKDIHALIAQSGDLDRCYRCLTD